MPFHSRYIDIKIWDKFKKTPILSINIKILYIDIKNSIAPKILTAKDMFEEEAKQIRRHWTWYGLELARTVDGNTNPRELAGW